MRTTVAALFLWAHLGCAVQPAVGDSGEMDRRKAYNALGIEEGSSADDALDSFVDLVILQRSLEADLSVRMRCLTLPDPMRQDCLPIRPLCLSSASLFAQKAYSHRTAAEPFLFWDRMKTSRQFTGS